MCLYSSFLPERNDYPRDDLVSQNESGEKLIRARFGSRPLMRQGLLREDTETLAFAPSLPRDHTVLKTPLFAGEASARVARIVISECLSCFKILTF